MTATFPSLRGRGWSVYKRPTFSTRIAQHVSGREVRAALYTYPLWEFELTYEQLSDASATDDLRTLMGFYLQCQGQFAEFLYTDPTDNSLAGQVIAKGDGLTGAFTIARNLGGWVEPVGAASLTAVTVGGSAVSGWSVSGNVVTMASPPSAGLSIAVTGSFSYRCRFLDDVQEYENFMDRLWTLKSCKFRSIKP